MILIQYISLMWEKDCRGGIGAIERSKFPQAIKLPLNFFEYISFGKPVHWVGIHQKRDGFHYRINRRRIEEFDTKNSLRLGAIELIPKGNNCEIRYRYDWHRAIPERYKYTKEGTRLPLNELAFELCLGDYGRTVYNGRYVDIDTGTWYYKMDIVNVMISQENDVPLDCFLVNAPTHYYRQIAKLF